MSSERRRGGLVGVGASIGAGIAGRAGELLASWMAVVVGFSVFMV